MWLCHVALFWKSSLPFSQWHVSLKTTCCACFLQGNGVIVGLGICGVVFAATSSAATLMGDFRTGYMCLVAPKAMFVAQVIGQLIGAMLTPVAFMLFWGTGQVNVPNGPYPGLYTLGRARVGRLCRFLSPSL